MSFIRNTDLKKSYSEQVGTNSLSPTDVKMYDVGIPTIDLSPTPNFVKSLINTSGTIYTTPLDRDFYLMGFCMFARADSGVSVGSCDISFYPDGINRAQTNVGVATEVSGTGEISLSYNFPNRGILIQRNTAIVVTIGDGGGTCMIVGYLRDVGSA